MEASASSRRRLSDVIYQAIRADLALAAPRTAAWPYALVPRLAARASWALDLPAGRGEAVHAAGAGRVTGAVKNQGRNCDDDTPPFTCPDGAKGNTVTIDHGGGVTTYYQHLQSVVVDVGAWVDAATVIGGAGDSGPSTPGFVHLHFEKRHNGGRLDPVGLKACHGSRLTSYPAEWGKSSWSQVPAHGALRARSDGVGCATTWPPPDGTFVNEGGTIYRLAGGAPLWISGWSAVGGPHPYVDVTTAQLASLRQYPADGTAVHDGVTGAGYVFAGGAPLYVASWSSVGNPTSIAVDGYPLNNIGSAAPLGHVRRYPADGTVVHNGAPGPLHGAAYVFAGGAPLYVSSFENVGNPPRSTMIDQYALDNAGEQPPLNHARRYPADGTAVHNGAPGPLHGAGYVFAGGAPLYVASWANVGNPASTMIDQYALDNAGDQAHLNHSRRYPADGTLTVHQGGQVSRFAGGAPIAISDWSHVGGPQPATLVDGYAFSNAGPDAPLNHVRRSPADGTRLLGRPSGRVWRLAKGCRTATSGTDGVEVSDSGITAHPRCLRITTATVAPAKSGHAYRAALTATGGTRPYTWTVASGRLPAGVTLSRSGVLSGRPSRVGVYRFQVRVADAADATPDGTKGYRLDVRS